jgi:glycosyltransferase involved in cell wall biosynthesis
VATSTYETPGDSARDAFESIPDITLLALDLGRPLSTERGAVAKALAMLHNLRGVSSLLSLTLWCRRQRVDVVHVTERPRDALFGLLLARLAGCACLVHAHTSFYAHPTSPISALADWALRHANGVVGVSRFTAATFERDANVPAERVFAVHNAVDVTVSQSDVSSDARLKMRRQLGIPDDAPVVGSVGRLMQGKDQASLLEAMVLVRETLPEARLIIAGLSADVAPDGRGTYGEYLVRRVDELGLRGAVVFTGFLAHHEMPRLYAAFDVFVHPCVEEPFGLVVVEAMARLQPVIAVNAGGIPEIIRQGVDGLLVPPREPALMAERIVGVLSDPVRAGQLARAGRERVLAAFTPGVQAAAMVSVYRRIAGRPATAALLQV